MPRKTTVRLWSKGWETAHEKSWRLCPADYGTYSWENWALIFQVPKESDKPGLAEKFQHGLEATLGQCRHAAGTIEKNNHGDFSVVTKPESTVIFVVQWLDGPEDQYPSFSEWEKAHFCSKGLGDPNLLTVFPRSSDASPKKSQPTMAFQLNFIPGGMLLNISSHHWFMDATGVTSFINQLAANCCALENGTPPPSFDESLMDRSRFIRPPLPDKAMINYLPPAPPPHPDRLPCAWLLFHLPLSKAAELKKLATPVDGSRISTYDAVVAFLWRVSSKNRAQIYKTKLKSKAIFGEPVDMRNRVSPPVSRDYQGILQCGGLSLLQKKPLTVAEVISDAPLSRVASFIRSITESVTVDQLEKTMARNARVRDKMKLHKTLDCLPPLSFVIADWRAANVCGVDFGFSRSVAVRTLADDVVGNLMMLYPRRQVENDPDHGWEIVLPFEKQHVDMLINDPDLKRFLTFWGYEAEDPQSKALKPRPPKPPFKDGLRAKWFIATMLLGKALKSH